VDPDGVECQRIKRRSDQEQSRADACIPFRKVDRDGRLLRLTRCEAVGEGREIAASGGSLRRSDQGQDDGQEAGTFYGSESAPKSQQPAPHPESPPSSKGHEGGREAGHSEPPVSAPTAAPPAPSAPPAAVPAPVVTPPVVPPSSPPSPPPVPKALEAVGGTLQSIPPVAEETVCGVKELLVRPCP
jgi:hypothetical protein